MADIPDEQRPREKALAHGIKALTDEELMAIVFSTGIKGKGVMAICREILAAHEGHLSRLARTPLGEFIKANKGIGPAKALTLLAGIELGVRAAADALKDERKPLKASRDAYEYMNQHLYNLDHEEFWIVPLRQNLVPITEICVGRGGLTATAVDVKIVMREALSVNAACIMLFHNHPSGNLTPSSQDMALTRKITDAAALFDIRVLDHIIVGHHNYYSFRDEGRM